MHYGTQTNPLSSCNFLGSSGSSKTVCGRCSPSREGLIGETWASNFCRVGRPSELGQVDMRILMERIRKRKVLRTVVDAVRMDTTAYCEGFIVCFHCLLHLVRLFQKQIPSEHINCSSLTSRLIEGGTRIQRGRFVF